MPRKRILTASLLAALSPAIACAGPLASLYQLAMDNDPQLKAAQATYAADGEALAQARGQLLPQVSASANTTYNDTASYQGNSHGYTLTLSQPVFDANRWFQFKQGQTLNTRAQAEFSLAQQNLILRSTSAYLDVLGAQSTLELAQARERALQKRLDQVNAQFEVGLIAITDVLDAQASYDAANVQLIEARGALRNSLEALERLAGQEVNLIAQLQADYPIQSVSPAIPEPWLTRALEQNLEYRISQLSEAASRHSLQAVRGDRLPSIQIEAQSGQTNQGSQTSDSDRIALTLAVPLFTGGTLSANIREADQRHRAALFTAEDQRRNVIEQTRSLLRDLNTSVESVKARAQSIKSRQTALDATEEGFSVGTRNVVDVLDAENALYEARQAYADARYQHVATLFRFKQAVGSLSPDDLLALDEWLESDVVELSFQ
ncbi:MAG: transporter [Oceanospirillaceae bacterium]|nr:transporter [Oceanospirillaceae bacterium]